MNRSSSQQHQHAAHKAGAANAQQMAQYRFIKRCLTASNEPIARVVPSSDHQFIQACLKKQALPH